MMFLTLDDHPLMIKSIMFYIEKLTVHWGFQSYPRYIYSSTQIIETPIQNHRDHTLTQSGKEFSSSRGEISSSSTKQEILPHSDRLYSESKPQERQ